MKAAILDAPGKLKIQDIAEPQPGDKEVLVKVDYCGVCGSDVKIYKGHWTIPFPRVLGHEFSGEVVATGKEVKGIQTGDRVTVDPNEYCSECEYCRDDKPHFCPNMIDHGILVDGGFAELAKAGEKVVHKLPDNVSMAEGSFTELLSCAVHAINRTEIQIGDEVAVFGGGPGGQILHQLAAMGGAGRVVLFTRSKEKLDLARKLGATEAINPDEVNLTDFKFDIVIDAVGSRQIVETALKSLIKKMGKLVVFGQAAEGEDTTLDLFNLLVDEITIIPTFINPFTTSQAIRLLEQKKIQVEPLISHSFALDEAQKGFDVHMEKVPGTVKVVLRP